MDAQNEETGNSRKTEGLDLGGQYRESFDHAGLTERYIRLANDALLNINPIERIYNTFATAPDDVKKSAYERGQKSVQQWLDVYDKYLAAGESLPVNLLGFAADIARQKREALKK